MTHEAVIHADTQALIVPTSDVPEPRLYLSLAYTEVLGDATYDHYDCWGVRPRY
jgi:hypothetical protein